MSFQHILQIPTTGRGFTDITAKVAAVVSLSGANFGMVHVFAQHTSCSVVITENADPAVLVDLEKLAQRWAPDGDRAYRHDTEGDDDMAAHARSILAGTSVTVPITDAKLGLGTWQGIYLWEHRTHPQSRRIVVTISAGMG